MASDCLHNGTCDHTCICGHPNRDHYQDREDAGCIDCNHLDIAAGRKRVGSCGGWKFGSRGEQLDVLMLRMDAATKAWVEAGRPSAGDVTDEREQVFADLRSWTARSDARLVGR